MKSQPAVTGVGNNLIADHQHLDALFERLLDDIHGGDASVCQATWTTFEKALLAHLEFEEVLLLPMFEATNPEETETLRRQHAKLRYLLAEMGVRLELHAVKEENVRSLVEFLRAHALREEVLLYRWSNALSREAAESLIERLPSQ